MADRKVKYKQVQSYYDGNAVRKLREMPEYETQEYYPSEKEVSEGMPLEEERQKTNPGVRRKVKGKEKQKLDVFSSIFLTAAIGITLYTCIGYLNVQAQITGKNNEITQLERKLAKMENDNDASLAKIDTSVDLNYIYNYATQKLGMVYPDDKQVIPYERNVSDYVKQYADIPKAAGNSLLDRLTK